MCCVRSIGFSEECLGLHYGHVHKADLGDGDSKKSEHILARQYYFPKWGTCWESIAGSYSLYVPIIYFMTPVFRWESLPRLEAERLGNRYRSVVFGVSMRVASLLVTSTDIHRFPVFQRKR